MKFSLDMIEKQFVGIDIVFTYFKTSGKGKIIEI